MSFPVCAREEEGARGRVMDARLLAVVLRGFRSAREDRLRGQLDRCEQAISRRVQPGVVRPSPTPQAGADGACFCKSI